MPKSATKVLSAESGQHTSDDTVAAAPDTSTRERARNYVAAQQDDDPLVSCLTHISRLHGNPVSAASLTHGLPLKGGRLTLELFSRAAERAGFRSKLIERSIKDISAELLPAVLLFNGERCGLLLQYLDNGYAIVDFPESGGGTKRVSVSNLANGYTGYAFIVKPVYTQPAPEPHSEEASNAHWFWGAVNRLWPTYAQVILAAAMVNLLALAAPLFIMNVYDRVLPNKAMATLWVLATGMALAIAFDFVLKTLRSAMIGHAGRRADVLMAGRLFSHAMTLDLGQRPTRTGEYAHQMRNFEFVREFFTSNTLAAITDILFVGLFVIIIYLIAGPLAYVPLAAVLVVLVAGIVVQFPLASAVKHVQDASGHRYSLLLDALSGLETIKSTGAEGQLQSKWEQAVGHNSQVSEKIRFISSLSLNFTTMVQQMVTVCVVLLGVYLFKEGEISPGALIASVILSSRTVAPLGALAGTLTRAQQAYHAFVTLDALMASPDETRRQTRFTNERITQGDITFEKVSFAYPGAQRPALSDLSFLISAGEHIGVIGKIGSGKTTFGRLLNRLYLPSEGLIKLNGIDITQYHPGTVRKRVAFVSQDADLFHGSVRENIAFGSPQISDAQIREAADLAGVTAFTDLHPSGLDMPVGEGGRHLSSGQRQSVALARAFLLHPAVIFLDEPTGRLDTQSEKAFVDRVRNALLPGQTLILTTHRNRPLDLVDRLLVLDNGRLVADGPKDKVINALSNRKVASLSGSVKS